MTQKETTNYTMQDLADYINQSEDWPLDVENIIEGQGWVSDCETKFGICHNDTEKVILNDNGEAVVVPIVENPALESADNHGRD